MKKRLTKRQKLRGISTQAEHAVEVAIYKLTKQLEAAQGQKWVSLRIDRMTSKLVPAEPYISELTLTIAAKKQLLELLRTGKVAQP